MAKLFSTMLLAMIVIIGLTATTSAEEDKPSNKWFFFRPGPWIPLNIPLPQPAATTAGAAATTAAGGATTGAAATTPAGR
ncbi:hypothetical protein Ocin01_00612 [Orchesella cincta]|uniref:Uncharacterized protein n=1 Tax=Orchesella cincta TaxID=48709 RepID=A0A1D2NLW3_ORCCI|nr:hypothetical protein Ocin01_00612 [Orchesella cincta]